LDVRPTAALLLLARLLALPAAELGVAVADAVDRNPALEFTDRPRCAGCGRVLRGRRCRWCSGEVATTVDRAAWENPRDTLRHELHVALPASEHALADRVVDELDDRGLLGRSAAALARELDVPLARFEAVLDCLQRLAPAGVGAADVRAALLAQLDAWRGEAPPLRTRAVLEHADALLDGGPANLARRLGAPVDEVTAALAFVSRHFSPAPLDLSAPEPVGEAPVDLIVHEADDGSLRVEIAERAAYGIRLAPSFRLAAGDRSASPASRAWAAERVQAARLFLAQLDRRTGAVLRVAQRAVVHQAEFVRRGPLAHQPLTRGRLAMELGLHESTVSRAVAGKRVRLPCGDVVPLDAFFGTAVAAKAALRILLAQPLTRSDNTLAAELARCGHPVARRTVAKYRAELARAR
jgi:RNA polymerase sigma-54 factor